MIGDLSQSILVIYNADQGTSRAGHHPKKTYVFVKLAAQTSSQVPASTSVPFENRFADATPAVDGEVDITVTQIEGGDVGGGASATSVRNQIIPGFSEVIAVLSFLVSAFLHEGLAPIQR